VERDAIAREALISRVMDASAQGIPVNIIVAGIAKLYRVQNPVSSGGVLSFETPRGNKIRIVESTIIGIIEAGDED
jgi:hypothetical protein